MARPQSRKKTDKAGGAAGATTTSAEAHHEHADVYHNNNNSHGPCCRLLEDIAKEILPVTSESKESTEDESKPTSTSFLAKALRNYLLVQQQQAAASASASNNDKNKKKRKKKKKKKAASGPDTDSVSATTTATASTATQENGNVNVNQQHHHKPEQPSANQDSDPSPIVAAAAAQPTSSHNTNSALSSYLDRILQSQSQSSGVVGADDRGVENEPTIATFCQVLASSASASSSSSKTVFHVPQADLLKAVAAIQCRSCRNAVENILSVESRVPLPLIPHDGQQRHQQKQQQYTGRSHVMANMNDDNDDDDAFDYVAMEEGAGVPTKVASDNDNLVFDFVADAGGMEAGWQFRQSSGEPVQWTLDVVVDRLVKDYILLAGLPPDQIMGADSDLLPPNLVTSIQDSVDSRYEHQTTDFTLMTKTLEAGVVKFAATADHAVMNIEMMSFPVCKEVDETCCDLLERLLRIILKMTRVFQDVLIYGGSSGSSGSGESPTPRSEAVKSHAWALNGIMDLWSMYMAAIDDINTAVIEYEEQLFELATRGAITQMFLSSTSRSLYRKMVEVKIRVVLSTIHSVQVRMDRLEYLDCVGGEDWAAPFSRKLFAYEAFFKVVASLDDYKKHVSKLPVDHACEDVLTTAREWIETVHQGTVSKIMEIHEHRREKLLRLLRVCDTHLTEMVEAARDGNETSYNALSTMRQDQELPQRFFANGDDDEISLRMLRMEIGARTLKTIRLWLGLRMHSNPDGYESERRVVMPYKLHGWVASRAGFRRHDVDGDADGDFCSRGGGGNTRAVCILVGLLYRWMSDRCKEWQAEVAEQELLTAVEEDDNNKSAETQAAGKSTNKPSKKSKKKKDKKDHPVGISDPVNEGDTKENLTVAVDSKSVATESRDGAIQSSLEADTNNGVASSFTEPKAVAGGLRVPELSLDTNGSGQKVAAHERPLASTVAAPAALLESKILEVTEKGGGGAGSSADNVSSVAEENHKTVKPLTAKKQQTGVDNVDPTGKAKSHATKKGNGRKEKMKNGKPVEDPRLHTEDNMQPVVTQDIDANISVGVYHKSTFESAEDFFVGRLLAITHAMYK